MFTKKNMKEVVLNQVNEINGKKIYFETTMGGRYFVARDVEAKKTLFTRASLDTAIAKINAYCG